MVFATQHECRTHEVAQERDAGIVVQAEHLFEVPAQSGPALLQRDDTIGACLQMHVVWGGGAAARTVVEHHHIRIAIRQLMHHRIVAADALGLMTRQRNREMHGQNGIGVHEQFVAMLAVAARHRP